jgi:hypothetical protein
MNALRFVHRLTATGLREEHRNGHRQGLSIPTRATNIRHTFSTILNDLFLDNHLVCEVARKA